MRNNRLSRYQANRWPYLTNNRDVLNARIGLAAKEKAHSHKYLKKYIECQSGHSVCRKANSCVKGKVGHKVWCNGRRPKRAEASSRARRDKAT
eukprot:1485255-Amphidinium_carterae.1